jgi:predicted ATPase
MIDYIKIEGFKSIKMMEMELRPINILIGSNGSGKSNFVSFFKLISSIFNRRLQKYVAEEKADNILHYGRKNTRIMKGKIIFTDDNREYNNAYYFRLAQTKEGGLYIDREGSGFEIEDYENEVHNYFENNDLDESKFAISTRPRNVFLRNYISKLQVFHFHDTSPTSLLRRECDLNDNGYLKQDGRNLPAFLYFLKVKHLKIFTRIEKAIRSVAPYISKLILEPSRLNEKEIELRWVDNGDPESSFSAYQLSDGTLRFIALATLLLQPEPPDVIIIDEPELGLHPFAINKLAGMIQFASSKAQVIVATQSPGLISNFAPEDVIVMDRSEAENQTVFNRLQSENLKIWLEDATLGELWERNIINAAQPFLKH